MQAVRIHEHGGPERLSLESAGDPVAGAGEAVVRVRACALNHLDLFLRQGIPGVDIGLPRILGSDISGEIAALGPGCPPPWQVGQAVVLAPGIGCGHCHACLAGDDNECRDYTLLGYRRDGGYAEGVVAPVRNLLPLPAGLDYVQAASIPLVFLTAWNMLVVRAGARAGQSVLVWAASSGVGIAAVQIAKLLGCRVVATAGGADKVELARRLGADAVIDHYDREVPVARAVKRLHPAGVDIVVEHVGKASWEESLRALARGGTLVTCGATTGHDVPLDLRFLFSRQLRLMGSYMGRRADLDTVLAAVASGALRPVVDRVFPLAEVAEAHRYLEAGRQFGKVVLAV